MEIFASILFGLSVFLFLFPKLKRKFSRRGSQVPLPQVDTGFLVKGPFGRILKIFLRRFSFLTSRITLKKKRRQIEQLIFSSGFSGAFGVDEFFGLKVLGASFFGFFGFSLAKAIGSNLIYFSLCFLVFGFFVPDQVLKGRRKLRHSQIRRALPFVMDLMTLSVEAGLDFLRSVQRVIERGNKSPLTQEFEDFLKELNLGATRQEGLQNLAWRVDLPEVSTFVSVLIQATQLGASIGDTLRAQADKIRAERFIRAEKAGAEAAQKLLVPLIFVIVPAIFLVLLTPVAIRLFQSELF